jgi:hypothetical protein
MCENSEGSLLPLMAWRLRCLKTLSFVSLGTDSERPAVRAVKKKSKSRAPQTAKTKPARRRP